ncbi:ATP-binding protein [Falsiroseomonas sp.]|uniref:ATP-binding protein n=1 Tax=Falsiroseomonas sp. TaxID=2870721 RepID=UPI003569A0DE
MLQGVAGGLDMARRRMEAGRLQEAATYLDAARDATGRAAGLTRRLLAFARRQRLEPQPLDPDALVRSMTDLLRRTLGPAIALELQLDDGCGFVTCDPNELESALLNLCINARDAMPNGGQLLVATRDRALSAADLAGPFEAAPGEYVEIAVTDTGCGMPPEVLEHALEPFFTTKPLGHGTGLGLSQIYGFVRQSGGALRIESSPGRGTTVRLWLPFSARREHAEAAPADVAAPAQDGGGATILLVDDETGVREPAAARLRDLGYTVVEAPDGPAALRRLDEGLRPDLLVTDVGLPDMDGVRVAEAVQRRLPSLPVLYMTGYATATLPLDAQVVTKPFTMDALTARVRSAIAPVLAGRG